MPKVCRNFGPFRARGRFYGLISTLLHHPVSPHARLGQLFNVAHHAVPVPLRVDLGTSSVVKPGQALVVADVCKHWLHGTKALAVKLSSGAAFLWLLLQHVLPKGFRRARNFVFLHPNSKRRIALLHWVLKVVVNPVQAWVKPRATLQCPCCGEAMQIVRRRMCPPALGREPDEALVGVAML